MASLASLYNAEKTVDDMTAFIQGFIEERSPGFLTAGPDAKIALSQEELVEICVDMFESGALYAENANGIGTSKIVGVA